MIQIDRIYKIPELSYSRYSQQELRLAGGLVKEIERHSREMYLVSIDEIPVLVYGLIHQSLLMPPRVWFLVGANIENGSVYWALRIMRRVTWENLSAKYGRLQTTVEKTWRQGQRFARFFGFRPTEQEFEMNGKTFVVMEM